MIELLWWVFAALAVGGAVGMIIGRNPVASLLFLVLTFFSLAAIYVLLGAHFIAVTQVIVYAGAIMVLFLFVIMLLNLGHDYHSDVRHGLWVVVGFVCAGVIGYVLSHYLVAPRVRPLEGNVANIEAAVRELGAVGAIAQPLFRDYLVPFELTSILLLVAVIGAVLLAKRRI
jgi:NADH-quinone oxidoreductase subunit J